VTLSIGLFFFFVGVLLWIVGVVKFLHLQPETVQSEKIKILCCIIGGTALVIAAAAFLKYTYQF
jgi:hypothetical protein